MSAPTTERTRTRARTATVPAQRTAPPATPRRAAAPAQSPQKKSAQKKPAQKKSAQKKIPQRQETAGRSGGKSALKAYARRDDRLRRLVGGRPARSAAPAGRAQFVLLVMVLLVGGLVATLWLSTAAAADSYHLQDARAEARTLSEQSARLHREVAAMEAAPALARRAGELGMVPVQDPARLVVGPDGAVTLAGEPVAAAAPAPPPAPAPPAPPADPAGPVVTVPVDAVIQAQPDAPVPAVGTPDPAAAPAAPDAAAPDAAAAPAAPDAAADAAAPAPPAPDAAAGTGG